MCVCCRFANQLADVNTGSNFGMFIFYNVMSSDRLFACFVQSCSVFFVIIFDLTGENALQTVSSLCSLISYCDFNIVFNSCCWCIKYFIQTQ